MYDSVNASFPTFLPPIVHLPNSSRNFSGRNIPYHFIFFPYNLPGSALFFSINWCEGPFLGAPLPTHLVIFWSSSHISNFATFQVGTCIFSYFSFSSRPLDFLELLILSRFSDGTTVHHVKASVVYYPSSAEQYHCSTLPHNWHPLYNTHIVR